MCVMSPFAEDIKSKLEKKVKKEVKRRNIKSDIGNNTNYNNECCGCNIGELKKKK